MQEKVTTKIQVKKVVQVMKTVLIMTKPMEKEEFIWEREAQQEEITNKKIGI